MITRRENTTEKAIKAVEKAVELGIRTKLNVVAMRNFNDDELLEFVEFIKTRPVELRFIEFMPFDSNQWNNKKFIPFFEQKDIIEKGLGLSLSADTLDPNHTSKIYSIPGYQGKVGFISSMTEHFCGGCNRLRLTADGNLKICLFDNRELNLKEIIHEDESYIAEKIQEMLMKKHYKHGGMAGAEEIA
jgi:cyclic pyranopterin phosphate synthase